MTATLILSTIVLVLITILYLFATWKFRYWEKRKVPHTKPIPLLGNYGDYILLRKYMGQVLQDVCKPFPREPYVGAYYGTQPVLILQDPGLIKLVTTKDFPYFNGREISDYTHNELVTQNLFFTYGDRWKLMRQSMSPVFSPTKVKNMFYLVEKCVDVLEEMVDREFEACDIVEVRSIAARYTMDAICSCGFGIEVNTMDKDSENNPFRKMGQLIFSNSTLRGFLFLARAIWPGIFYTIGLKAFPDSIINFFHKILVEVFESREYKPSGRNDFVDMILNLKKNGYISCDKMLKPGEKVDLKIDDEFLVAQCVVFFAAGYETSSTTLSFALYELAKDLKRQDNAFKEIEGYLSKRDGEVQYDCVTELPYLDAVLDETLRLYPVLGVLTREVMEDYTLPDGLKLEKGLRIHLPVYHLHHNPDNFPDPEEFRPERFLPENKQNITPYTYIPFGEGPRICIGMRIAKMQMLPALVCILKKYRVELAQGMPRSVEFDPRVHPTEPTCGINLKFERR